MPPELAAAIVALLLAAAQLATVELRVRAARREADELRAHVLDAQRAAGATRRTADPPSGVDHASTGGLAPTDSSG